MTLQQLMGKGGIVLAPGIYDALSGLIATQMGAKTVYLSGASLAYTRFGRSDVERPADIALFRARRCRRDPTGGPVFPETMRSS